MSYTRLNPTTLRPGVQYDLSGLIAPGYITASGNYVNFCIHAPNSGINGVSSATIHANVRTPSGVLNDAIDASYTPLIATNRSENYLVLELKFKTTQTANVAANVFLTNGSNITFS